MKDLAEINRRVFRMEKQIENLEIDNKHLHEMLDIRLKTMNSLIDTISMMSERIDVAGERIDIARDHDEMLEAMIVENSDKIKTL